MVLWHSQNYIRIYINTHTIYMLLLLRRSVVSDSVRPHRRQPTRLPRPWDFPGKNTGVGCHFLLQCMKVKSESESEFASDSSDPMNCSPPGPSVHGTFQEKVLEWGAIAFSEYICKFQKCNSGHRTEKGQFSFQSQRRAMPKNIHATAQLHSSHTLAM